MILTYDQCQLPGLRYVIGRVWQAQEPGAASDVCCGHTFGKNGRRQAKDLPSLTCSSSSPGLAAERALKRSRGSKFPKEVLASRIHSVTCLRSNAPRGPAAYRIKARAFSCTPRLQLRHPLTWRRALKCLTQCLVCSKCTISIIIRPVNDSQTVCPFRLPARTGNHVCPILRTRHKRAHHRVLNE